MTSKQSTFNPWKIIIFVALALLSISFFSTRYAQQVTLPRYCDNPEQALYLLEEILTKERPAGDETRRPYIIAAKLLFLLPRQADEPISNYLNRVRQHLQKQCM
ncbi:MAG: hypothetical protein DRQ49_07275 [Gammaproteobacteria bacterium]|nr:MAG: hypothetical protein DRQ41_13965 [Gammaproteobacteria bacterium]RKZ40774.1 MAG: hypothetical protein DRQ49_07275 [Gammaproteobacteria bacterium]RKZ72087.1 MAG: hypothetical protein DRQ57_17850 [Gammaproteobacteria bacterium]